MKFALWGLPLLALATACSQSDAPSEQMEAAAENLVDTVLETPAPVASATLGRYAPRNDCGDLPGAKPFLSMLNAAIEMRDTDVLVALSANDVKLGFGGEDGAAYLRRALDAEGSALWSALEKVSGLGCAVNTQGGIIMPWYFAQDISGDPFETMIVTGSDVAVHAEPRDNSPRIASVTWDAVDVVMDGQPVVNASTQGSAAPAASWTHIRMRSDAAEPAEGYILSSNLRSVVDYRLIASSRNGRWRITAMLAGD